MTAQTEEREGGGPIPVSKLEWRIEWRSQYDSLLRFLSGARLGLVRVADVECTQVGLADHPHALVRPHRPADGTQPSAVLLQRALDQTVHLPY